MAHSFKTKSEALEASYTPVNRQADRDTSGHRSFGYSYEDADGSGTVTVWLSEELNQLKRKGCFIPMYPPE